MNKNLIIIILIILIIILDTIELFTSNILMSSEINSCDYNKLTKNKKFKKVFIVKPRNGLCNQLQTIVNSILLAEVYNRDIYFDKFEINIYNNNLDSFDNIISIDNLNKLLLELNIDVRIIKTIDDAINIKMLPNYDQIPTANNINIYIDEYNHESYIDIGNPVSLDRGCKYLNVLHGIPFQQRFYDKANLVKDKLNFDKYICIHLRLEDDALNFYSVTQNIDINELTNKLKNEYLKIINNNCNTLIYVCTSLNLFDNINNEFYTNLKSNNKNIIDKQSIEFEKEYIDNRELAAIVDLIIAIDAHEFYGWGWSSYSNFLSSMHQVNNNKTYLINIHD
jgi:hypothetical protein